MTYLHRLLTAALAAFFIAGSALAQNSGTVTNHAYAIGKGAGTTGYTSLLCTSAQLAVGQTAADPICRTITGDWTLSAAGAVTLATVNANVGSFGSATASPTFTVNAKGLITAASSNTITPAIGSVTGLGAGCATFLATPSSANLRGCLTDEAGTGAAYFVGGALGTPASGTATNLTGLPLSGLTAQAAFTFVGNNTSGSAVPTAVDIAALTAKASPAAGDYVILSDQAASGAWKRVTVSSLASAGSVASLNGLTGALNVRVIKQIFTASGTYTPTSGMVYAVVECVGGGGGGGGVLGVSAQSYGAGGGGSGGYSRLVATAATIGASKSVTIGALGAGGTAGANNGSAAGDTCVGGAACTTNLCVGKGGSGGLFGNSAGSPNGGAGGVAGTGDLAAAGVPGNTGFYSAVSTIVAFGGNGGSSQFGGGGAGVVGTSGVANAGAAAGAYGGGGAGAVAHNTTNTAAGGNGSAGVVFITEYVVN